MGNGVSSRFAESPIPVERDVSATGGNPSSEDEVPTSVSRGAKQTNENLPCESERPPVRYSGARLVRPLQVEPGRPTTNRCVLLVPHFTSCLPFLSTKQQCQSTAWFSFAVLLGYWRCMSSEVLMSVKRVLFVNHRNYIVCTDNTMCACVCGCSVALLESRNEESEVQAKDTGRKRQRPNIQTHSEKKYWINSSRMAVGNVPLRWGKQLLRKLFSPQCSK